MHIYYNKLVYVTDLHFEDDYWKYYNAARYAFLIYEQVDNSLDCGYY